jgi:hypothetical protein
MNGEDDMSDTRRHRRERPEPAFAMEEPVSTPEPPPERQPPPDAIMAEDWQLEPKDLPWAVDARCYHCNHVMWTRQPLRHDICETCGWLLRDEAQSMAAKQRAHAGTQLVNPFGDNVFGGQTGSLPKLNG